MRMFGNDNLSSSQSFLPGNRLLNPGLHFSKSVHSDLRGSAFVSGMASNCRDMAHR